MSTLIIYSTKHGAAGKCALMLSKKLTGEVDIHNLKEGEPPGLTKYEKVIIGGSIYAGRIQKEVSRFCSQNVDTLKNKKLGFFISCMFKDNADTQLKANFPSELLEGACAKDSFGAEMRFSDMSFGEKLLTKLVSKTIAKNDPKAPAIDMKSDMSMICEESIDRFAQQMNNV